MITPSQAKWPLLALAWAALIVFAVWISVGGGVSGPAELAGGEAAEASRVRSSEALLGELGARLREAEARGRRFEEENAGLRARLVREAEDSRAVIDRQAAVMDALTRLLEAPADLPAGDARPDAEAGGRNECARGGPMGDDDVLGR